MTETKLTARQVHELAGSVERIRSLDSVAISIGEHVEENAEGWGAKIRDVLGRNRMDKWRNRFLGEVVAAAIMTELMRERDEIAAEIEAHVDVAKRPMPDQFPDRENR